MEYSILGRSGIRVSVIASCEETTSLSINTGKLDNARAEAQVNGCGNFA